MSAGVPREGSSPAEQQRMELNQDATFRPGRSERERGTGRSEARPGATRVLVLKRGAAPSWRRAVPRRLSSRSRPSMHSPGPSAPAPEAPPAIRTAVVHWGRMIVVVAVLTAALGWLAGSRFGAVLDHPAGALAAPLLLLGAAYRAALSRAEYRLTESGILRVGGREVPWAEVAGCTVAEEMDGTRSLTVQARDGTRPVKVFEKGSTGMEFEAFATRLATEAVRRAPVGGEPAVAGRIDAEHPAARAPVAALVLGIAGLGVATLLHPPRDPSWTALRLAVMALLAAPLAWRAFGRRRR